jgi:hypothetical protein
VKPFDTLAPGGVTTRALKPFEIAPSDQVAMAGLANAAKRPKAYEIMPPTGTATRGLKSGGCGCGGECGPCGSQKPGSRYEPHGSGLTPREISYPIPTEIDEGVLTGLSGDPLQYGGGITPICEALDTSLAHIMANIERKRIAYETIERQDSLCFCATGPADCYSYILRQQENRARAREITDLPLTRNELELEDRRRRLGALDDQFMAIDIEYRACTQRLRESQESQAAERISECRRIRDILVERFNELARLASSTRRSIANIQRWSSVYGCALQEYGQTDFDARYNRFETGRVFLRPRECRSPLVGVRSR